MENNLYTLIKEGRVVNYQPPFKSFDQLIRNQARKYGKKLVIIFEDFENNKTIQISYRELDNLTENLAKNLVEKWKLAIGSRFSFSLTNTPETILLNYSAWRAGLVTVPLDPRRDTIQRKVYKLKLTKSKLLFTDSSLETKKENIKIKKSIPNIKIVEIESFKKFKTPVANTISANGNADFTKTSDLRKDCLILFTSGTTALPKGVRLTLQSLFANAESIAMWLRFDESERFYIFLPLHHINAITFANTTILSGGTLVLSSRYSKSQFWNTMAKHKATGSSIVPTIAYDLLSEEKSFKKHQKTLKTVRRMQIGSAPVQPNVVEEFIRKYFVPLYQGYGQTETSLRSTGVPMGLTPIQFSKIRKLNSLGTELKYTNVTVLNKKGQEVKENEIGEICIRGPIIMEGYLEDAKATKEAFKHNWLHSGDTGYFQRIFGRKFFFIKGRTKEIIKKGGYLISPLAIENTLLKNYPMLKRVYVVGFPDERSGQEIGIVVVTNHKSILTQIIEDGRRGKIKGLPKYESPQAALIVKESELPKTSTGKVQRIKIKKIYGPELLEQYRTITNTKTHIFRLIGPDEKDEIKEALKINNARWGKNLKSKLREFKARAQKGLLIGAFDRKGKLLGTISAIQVNENDIDKIGTKNHWANSWDDITGNGTLSTHKHKGNSLVCVAISTSSAQKSKKLKEELKVTKQKLTSKKLRAYLSGNRDSVVNFHRAPKGGLKSGAKISKIIPEGRPEDKHALGYNLLMKYPIPKNLPKISDRASIGTLLIEAAFIYAYQKRLRHIYVYSRPADLGKYFKKLNSPF